MMAVFSVIAIMGLGVWLQVQNTLADKAHAALLAESKRLANLSTELVRSGQPDTALLLALEGIQGFVDSNRPWPTDAARAIFLAIKAPKKLLESRKGAPFTRAKFSRDGKYVLVASSEGAILFDSDTGNTLKTFSQGREISFAEFSPDQKNVGLIAEGVPELWSIEFANLVKRFEHHLYIFEELEFNKDGSRLLSTSNSGVAVLWSINDSRFEDISSIKGLGGLHGAKSKFAKNGSVVITAEVSSLDSKNALSAFRLTTRSAESGAILRTTYLRYNDIDIGSDVINFNNAVDCDDIVVTVNSLGTGSSSAAFVVNLRKFSVADVMQNSDKFSNITFAGFRPGCQLLTVGPQVAVLWNFTSKNGHHSNYTFLLPDGGIENAIFDSTGMSLALLGGDNVYLKGEDYLGWDDIYNYYQKDLIGAEFSPDGNKIITYGESSFAIWEVGKFSTTFEIEENDEPKLRDVDTLLEMAKKRLPKNRGCLSAEERVKFSLPKLTNAEWVQRDCVF